MPAVHAPLLQPALLLLAICLLACPSPMIAGREIADEIVFGHYGTGIGEFLYPVGIAITPRGNVIVSDNGKTIERRGKVVHVHGGVSIFDRSGMYLGPVNPEGTSFGGPIGVAYDPAGCLYVVENGRHQVRKFNQAGKQLLVFGRPGGREGRFRSPRGIACDSDGHVYVADYRNRRIQEFDGDGHFVRSIKWVDPRYGKAARPRDVAIDGKERLWAVYTVNNRIVRFNEFGEAELVFGREGENLGQFNQPRYIAFDVRGNLYVSDHKNHRIQKFDDTGRFLYSYGVQGRAKGQLNFPEGVAVDTDGNIYIAEAGNKRVQIFKVRKRIRFANRGWRLMQAEQWEEAAKAYEQVLNLDPANREALDCLARCYTILGDIEFSRGELFKARRYYRRIARYEPSNAAIRRKIRRTIWLQNKGRIYYLVLGCGILLTMVFLVITMVKIIRSD